MTAMATMRWLALRLRRLFSGCWLWKCEKQGEEIFIGHIRKRGENSGEALFSKCIHWLDYRYTYNVNFHSLQSPVRKKGEGYKVLSKEFWQFLCKKGAYAVNSQPFESRPYNTYLLPAVFRCLGWYCTSQGSFISFHLFNEASRPP